MPKKTLTILDKIIVQKKKELKVKKQNLPVVFIKKRLKKQTMPVRSFRKALSKKGKIALIAEIKKASPSVGIIKKDFNIQKILNIYRKTKIDAVSVITDEKFFQGSLKFLPVVKSLVKVPVLRKDFIIDSYQIYESKLYGADAILLIAAILDNKKINRFIKIAKNLEMDSLVEIHTLKELKMVLKTNAEIIGINNRDLKTFKVCLETSLEVAPKIPASKIIISESGIKSRKEVKKLKKVGVKAILVGTTLMKSKNIQKTIKQLIL